MRWRGAISALLIFQLILVLPLYLEEIDGAVTSPSLVPGTTFTWSYSFQSSDGQSTRSGSMTAGVSQISWKGFDCYLFSGSIDGQFTTPEGSGDESGIWRGYYRIQDLAVLDSSQDLEYTISGYDILNLSDVSYDPGFEWIRFPLSYTPSQWNVEDQEIHTSWEVHIDEDPSYSGNEDNTDDLSFFVMNTGSPESVDVEAGIFDTYHIREKWMDDPNGRTVDTYYSDEIGWWVQKDIWIDGESERINLRHWELVDSGSNGPPASAPIPDITLDEDEQDSSIELDEVFSDPDGDDLEYGIKDNGTLPVTISNGRVHIIPSENEHGSWSFNITAWDSIYPEIRKQVNVTVNPIDDKSILTEAEYYPEQGDVDTEFAFTIHLSDAEGDRPSSSVLHLGSVTKDLSVISGSPADDLIIGWTGSLPVGSYEHYYQVDDVRYPATGPISGPVVSSIAVPDLSTGSFEPGSGGIDTEFTFSVIWEYEDGEEPDQVTLVLDGFDYPMDKSSGNPVTGSIYSLSTILPVGDHYHHYEAVHGDDSFRYPVSEISGPDVYEPEIMDFNSYETEDGVVFYCMVRYELGIDPDSVDLLLSGDVHAMTSEEGSITTGLNLSTSLDLGPGTYEYRFEITFGDRIYRTDLGTIGIEESAVDDDDTDDTPDDDTGDPDTSDGSDPDTLIVAAVIIGIAVLVVVAILILTRRPKEPSAETWEEEEVLGSDEGQSAMVRGI